MTPQPKQQEDIIDKMMQEYDCIFYPMCYRARALLYCPKKAGLEECEDYRSSPAPLTQNNNGDCFVICQHCGKITQVKCKETTP